MAPHMGTEPHRTGLYWETSLCKSAVPPHLLLYSTFLQALSSVLGKSSGEVEGCKDSSSFGAFLEFGTVEKQIYALLWGSR